MALLFGYDIGSSSIKATLMEAESGKPAEQVSGRGFTGEPRTRLWGLHR
jgi:cell division ATPase FtsA